MTTEVNYTEEMVAELEKVQTLNWESATALGVKMGKSAGSIVAKFKALDKGEYVAKERKAPVGVVNKKVYANEIATLIDVEGVNFAAMTKVDLIRVRDALVDLLGEVEEV